MKFVFLGQNVLGGYALRVLIAHKILPMLVVTRMENGYPNEVKICCEQHMIPFTMVNNLNKANDLISQITSLQPDLIFCCAWSHRIKHPLLDIPRLGWVNLHPSYLPFYRGPRPIEWQLINGEMIIGCTAHFMTEAFDAGAILAQDKFSIVSEDDGGTLRKKCGSLLGCLAINCIDILDKEPDFLGIPQDETQATYAPPRENVQILDCTASALKIVNTIRALSPYPCAIVEWNKIRLGIAKAEITTQVANPPMIGALKKDENNRLLLGTSDYYVRILALRIGNEIVDDYSTFVETLI